MSTTKQTKKVFPFKIGADPEFNFVLQNKKIKASEAIKQLMMNGTDDNHDGKNLPPYGTFGWDGHSPTGEIRPNPSNNPEIVTRNLQKMFEKWAEITTMFDMSTLSNKGSVGGHIHLEVSPDLKNSPSKTKKMHKAVSAFYLPLMVGENKANLKTRINNSYGSMNDFRIQDQGDAYTYEFRVPSAEWLTTPKLTTATLAYVATVMNEFLNNPENFKKFNDITYKNQKQGEALQQIALADYKTLTQTLTRQIKRAIKTFEFYPQYKTLIDYVMNSQKVIKDKEKVNYNILEGWGLIKTKQPTKKDLLSTKKLKDKSLKCDLDSLMNLVNIPHNADHNVNLFAKELQQRVVAMNWKLKNTYFLFGTRYGIKDFLVLSRNYQEIYGIKKQIKTKRDLAAVKILFQRMESNFLNRINNGTSGTKKEKSTHILIGIPYKQRVELDSNKLIELIYSIEKKQLPEKEINQSTLIDDTGISNSEELGKIFQIMNTERRTTGLLEDDYVNREHDINFRDAGDSLMADTEDEEEQEWCGECDLPYDECECD